PVASRVMVSTLPPDFIVATPSREISIGKWSMCGRFALTSTPKEVAALFDVVDVEDFPPRFNIAPTQPILMVAAGPRQPPGSNLPERRAQLVRWGFLPAWAKSPKDMPLLINARGETAAQKAAFRA